jgi:hypothetical protein
MPVLAKEKLIRVSTHVQTGCPLCSSWQQSGSEHRYFEEMCNHLFTHGLKCLHVGQETDRSGDGDLWQSTVAVFGK